MSCITLTNTHPPTHFSSTVMLSFKCSTKGRASEIHGVVINISGVEMHEPASVCITYKVLVALFGPPNSEDDPCKCDASWDLNGEVDGVSIGNVHLYNYKNG